MLRDGAEFSLSAENDFDFYRAFRRSLESKRASGIKISSYIPSHIIDCR